MGRWIRHHKKSSVLIALGVFLLPFMISLGSALGNPSLGTSLPGRLAEWTRGHGGASFVGWVENLWYSHHAPPVGGAPPRGAIPAPGAATAAGRANPESARHQANHLPAPAPIVPFVSNPLPGEGQWHPAGRLVGGNPAIYEAFLRPDAVHTSVVVGVAWMDMKLLSATLYSGSTIPGGGPYAHTAPISPSAANSLVAAFNAGFRMSDANGGYYTEGRAVIPLRDGAASFVIYRNGTATVGTWGKDVSMTSQVVAVRQNLVLLVDHGRPVPGLASSSSLAWGATLGPSVYVWRSGVGVTADGALVYAAGPGLDATTLADVLARAGAVRAMELDINTDWVSFSTFDPSPGSPATPSNGTNLLANMAGPPGRYFASWWTRDFFTMSARLTSG